MGIVKFTEMNYLKEYINKYAIDSIVNDYEELRCSSISNSSCRVIFPNGYYAHIVYNNSQPKKNAAYSVAVSDYNGWFDWGILKNFGYDDGRVYCNTEEEIIDACELIRNVYNVWQIAWWYVCIM